MGSRTFLVGLRGAEDLSGGSGGAEDPRMGV